MGNGKELRTHCSHGHEFTPDNTSINSCGARCCKACKREWYHKNKTLKGKGSKNQNTGKTHCKRGHEFTQENTYLKQGEHRVCRTCTNAAAATDQRKPSFKQVKRRARLKRLGWTPELFDAALMAQEGKCAICPRNLTVTDEHDAGTPCADHEHIKPPKPRGILCSPCNTALGLLKESPVTMQSMIGYVLKYK